MAELVASPLHWPRAFVGGGGPRTSHVTYAKTTRTPASGPTVPMNAAHPGLSPRDSRMCDFEDSIRSHTGQLGNHATESSHPCRAGMPEHFQLNCVPTSWYEPVLLFYWRLLFALRPPPVTRFRHRGCLRTMARLPFRSPLVVWYWLRSDPALHMQTTRSAR